MQTKTASAVACANIAFIKYWGNRDNTLRIASNNSISMNLEGLESRTTVSFDKTLQADQLVLNNESTQGIALERVSKMLDRVRGMSELDLFAQVTSANNFPTGSGIASSASGFAALALAACVAAGLDLSSDDLSRLARTSSGSASRSLPGGFVEWQAGNSHESSYAFTIAPPSHWALADCVTIVSQAHKSTGSYDGHALADTSPLQSARLADVNKRLDICRRALLDKDFSTFADIVELDSNMMHAVIMTSNPRLQYWEPATIAVMSAVQGWRAEGQQVCYTIDAGPNVHVICPQEISNQVASQLQSIPGVQTVMTALPGGPARLV